MCCPENMLPSAQDVSHGAGMSSVGTRMTEELRAAPKGLSRGREVVGERAVADASPQDEQPSELPARERERPRRRRRSEFIGYVVVATTRFPGRVVRPGPPGQLHPTSLRPLTRPVPSGRVAVLELPRCGQRLRQAHRGRRFAQLQAPATWPLASPVPAGSVAVVHDHFPFSVVPTPSRARSLAPAWTRAFAAASCRRTRPSSPRDQCSPPTTMNVRVASTSGIP